MIDTKKQNLKILHLEDDINDYELIKLTLLTEHVDCDLVRSHLMYFLKML